MKTSKEELVIREIIGPGRGDTIVFGYAIEAAEQLLFREKRYHYMGDVQVTREIYAVVAERLGRKVKSTARQIQRMSERCWNSMDEEQKLRYIGKRELAEVTPTARDMILYLAFYCHYGMPYYQVLKREIGR
ncbi:MAG: sporulation initiation factor Spo0A C-terminal domain-containing protein [Lachnospiraceae bacterium]|nr:sporulation initiation factor Spo0A C-terminal domain-containing protein [Lachnospiraceae bacterium]